MWARYRTLELRDRGTGSWATPLPRTRHRPYDSPIVSAKQGYAGVLATALWHAVDDGDRFPGLRQVGGPPTGPCQRRSAVWGAAFRPAGSWRPLGGARCRAGGASPSLSRRVTPGSPSGGAAGPAPVLARLASSCGRGHSPNATALEPAGPPSPGIGPAGSIASPGRSGV